MSEAGPELTAMSRTAAWNSESCLRLDAKLTLMALGRWDTGGDGDVAACWVLWVWHGSQLPRHCGSEGLSSPAPLNGKASHQVMERLAVEHMYWTSTAKALRCLLSSTFRRHFACATMAGPTISQLRHCVPYAIPSQRDWEYKKHNVKGGTLTSFYRKNTSK